MTQIAKFLRVPICGFRPCNEASHGLAAWAIGGKVRRLDLYPDLRRDRDGCFMTGLTRTLLRR
jgi:hypothetical protein